MCGRPAGAPCVPRRAPPPPAPPRPRPTYVIDLVRALQVHGGVRDAAELEERGQRSVSARAGAGLPFAGPFPERHCGPPGTRAARAGPGGLAAGHPAQPGGLGSGSTSSRPFLRGTQRWLHKVPTPLWTCGADARMCHCVELASCPEDLPQAHGARCFFSSGCLTQRNRQVLEVSVRHPRGRPLGWRRSNFVKENHYFCFSNKIFCQSPKSERTVGAKCEQRGGVLPPLAPPPRPQPQDVWALQGMG